ncbi:MULTISPECIES: NADH-quinone oxidoreductase subunit L [Sphingopyxis]|jgi:NAD(P)H-quinone oxidoreductase subunit 5|nr:MULTISPECIES: NADH-quinone oxidoreductase subunit L [Sphingopyxis]KGB57725.1 NADH-Ubiquinone/plastoquinone (Complex I), various chains family protein [Sphingopyxis sp. LC363]GGJ38711.1 NADH dehydrogenase [Sphingopyxis bauzanensis]
MMPNITWCLALGPLALAIAGLAAGRVQPGQGRVGGGAALIAGFALALAVATGIGIAVKGTLATGTIGVAGVGVGFYVDTLAAIMFALVAFVGLIVVLYSRNYLDGDRGQARFTKWLCLTLAAVLLLIVSGNLFQFALAWIATSLGLNKLLLFYPERQSAVLAARKKFLVSRLGDLCLIAAMVLLHQAFGSLDYAVLFAGAEAMRLGGDIPAVIHAVALLLVVAALLKSAQFPLHGWLTEVMETPTPVSALLHAGVINAGGFLVLRLADVISLSAPSMEVLVIVGGVTALFGSVVMLTQTSVKVSLAYSTIAQMGFMMLQCGLGAFAAALLHIVAHSLYKAHAFLASGSVIDLARASWSPSPGGQPHPARMAMIVGLVLAAALVVGTLFGATITAQPGVFALGAVVMLGLSHLITQAFDERPSLYVVARTVALAVAVSLAYFGLQWAVEHLLAGSLPPVQALRGPLDLVIVALVVLAFAAVTVFQSVLPGKADAPRWQAIYVHLANGLYVNTVANRLVLRFWPSPPPPNAIVPSTPVSGVPS